MITHHVYKKKGLVVVRGSGKPSLAEWRGQIETVRHEANFEPSFHWVIVVMDRETLSPDIAPGLVEMLVDHPTSAVSPPKCAIAVAGATSHEALDAAFARVSTRIVVRAFSSEGAALAWASAGEQIHSSESSHPIPRGG
jgi:hypothetical protein